MPLRERVVHAFLARGSAFFDFLKYSPRHSASLTNSISSAGWQSKRAQRRSMFSQASPFPSLSFWIVDWLKMFSLRSVQVVQPFSFKASKTSILNCSGTKNASFSIVLILAHFMHEIKCTKSTRLQTIFRASCRLTMHENQSIIKTVKGDTQTQTTSKRR